MAVSAAAGTLMACPPPLMEQERAFLAALQTTASYELSQDTLALKDQSGATIVRFVAEPQDLAGTSWDVTGYNNGRQAVVSLLAGTAITARFGPDGRLAGNAGCNDYAGACDLGEETIAIGPLRSTRKFCQEPEGLMEQERLYLEALQTAATYRIESRTLELRTADGALAVKFRRAAGEPATDQDSADEAAAPAGQACVTGLVTFAEPTTLPEDVMVQVRINDISRMDAPAVVMGEQIVSSSGSTPIPYCVCYNPDDIQPHHTYSMQAGIEDSTGALLYISNTITPVITRGAPGDGVEIAVIRVGR
jgi:heat shock protein HslJ